MNYAGKCCFLIILIFLTNACASQPFNHSLEKEARIHLESVDTYLAVPQDEIYADIKRSNKSKMMGGGLLFALIDTAVDNSRTKDAEALIQPIRNALLDYDYAEVLAGEIGDKLKSIEWLHARDIVLERSVDEDRFINRFKESNASAILFMTADYKIAATFDSVDTLLGLVMFPNVEALEKYKEKLDDNKNPVDQGDNIYRRDLVVRMPLEVSGTKEEMAKLLAENNAAELKGSLELSAKQIAESIVDDLISEKEKKESK